MSGMFGRFSGLFSRLSFRPNVSKKSILLVTSVGGLFTLFVTAIYLRRKRKPVPLKDDEDQHVEPVEASEVAKRKKRPKQHKIDLQGPSNSVPSEDQKHLTVHGRDHSVLSESSTVSSVKSATSRQSRIASLAAPGSKQYFEAEQLYRKGVNAFESALDQWEKAGLVLESPDKSCNSSVSIPRSRHSISRSSYSRSRRTSLAKPKSESESTNATPGTNIPTSGAGDNTLTEDQFDGSPNNNEIQNKLLLLMERTEKLQQTFEEVLYSSGSESDTDITLTEFAVDSDTESFVSAQETWDVQSVDDFQSIDEAPIQKLALYENALEVVESGQVKCRSLRTEMLECFSETDFLAKLHCVRQALDLMLQDETVREWLTESGRSMIECLLQSANRSTSQFVNSFNMLIHFVRCSDSWDIIEEELKHRKVLSMTFYDIVLDFIIMDSFDDLESPPSQLMAVLGNKWLSNSIKETALNTAVWSMLKAKTGMLRYQNGFMAKFYAVSETISPLLAWGFLGTDDKLKSDCDKFKSEVLAFLRGMFSFQQVRYSTLEQMSDDILSLAKEKIGLVLNHFEVSRR